MNDLPKTPTDVEAWISQQRKQGTPTQRILDTLERMAEPERASKSAMFVKLRQQYALVLSKFSERPAQLRHDEALKVLAEDLDLAGTSDAETLGIAGGICKRLWDDAGQRVDVDRAMVYYNRAHDHRAAGDDFYNSINAAYLEEVVAEQERTAGFRTAAVQARYEQAEAIHDAIIAAANDGSFVLSTWWHYATVADAYLGNGDSAQAAEWVKKGRSATKRDESQELTSLRHSARLIHLVGARRGEAWRAAAEEALAGAYEIDVTAARAAGAGKVGLALSGGGFRASLFHIGVLARLAETDLLRHVEVLSCVSGGSIIGAQYYLELKHLLETTPNPTRDDYVNLVARLASTFLEGVQSNIRTSAAARLDRNVRMLFGPGDSRTERVAELYDECLFAKAPDGASAAISGLNIHPIGAPKPFQLKEHNWRRSAKVPMLILNATTLNTGHQWQFTTEEMGEPPYTVAQLDAVSILGRRRYNEGERVRLSRAVAASSGVPGVFASLSIPFDGHVVGLVDGGVHDNQGVASLLWQECKTILVSDASGQLREQERGAQGTVSPVLRSNDILQARLRDAQLHDLIVRRRAGALQGLTIVHMTKGLRNDAPPHETTKYGIRSDLQKALAELRTDLDTFTNAEAWSLMTSGYWMMTEELKDPLTSAALTSLADPRPPAAWTFTGAGTALSGGSGAERLLALLRGTDDETRESMHGFKVVIGLFLVLLLGIAAYWRWWVLGVVLVVGLIARYWDRKQPKPIDEVLIGMLLTTAGWMAANIYLRRVEETVKKVGERV